MAADPTIRGIILAAGFGTRLAPVTDHLPKPLLPVAQASLLDHAAASLERAGVHDVAVNCHHLGEMITRHLEQGADAERFKVFHEKEILGTGGALHGARIFLETADHFIVFNGDVLCDADLSDLIATHIRQDSLATLLLINDSRFNTVHVDEGMAIRHIAGASNGDIPEHCTGLTYAGIGVFSSRLLKSIGPGFSSLITPLVSALAENPGCVRGYAPKDIFWNDLGTLKSYLQVCREVEDQSEGFAWLEKPPPHHSMQLEISRITGHGSDRGFWRLRASDWSAVAMQSALDEESRQEFHYQLEIGRFLHSSNLGAAEIYSADEKGNTLLMEDLGQASLLFLAGNPGTPQELLARRYHQVVEHLLKLQAFTQQARNACPPAVDRVLDRDVLLWETAYFRERFLQGHAGLSSEDTNLLVPEFETLARCVANQPLTLVHRDFQSQNIHFQAGKVRLVDIQGLRLGPVGYDIMSLIWDPYVELPPKLRQELLDQFAAGCGIDPDEARSMALAAGLQRLMQALGAYGFLGHVKGKKEYLKFIPRAVGNLRELLDQLHAQGAVPSPWLPGDLPELRATVASLDIQ